MLNEDNTEKVEFQNIDKTPEEEELQKEKQISLKNDEEKEQKENEKEEQKEEYEERKQEKQQEKQTIGIIGRMIGLVWNSIAGGKGYEAITSEESEVLTEIWKPVEAKYMGDIESPELQAVILTGVILVPKYLRKNKTENKNTEEVLQ